MKKQCIQNLEEIKTVLSELDNQNYAQKVEVLSGSSIGQHVRHILEFYLCLIQGLKAGVVNYDLRERNLVLESEVRAGIDAIEYVQAQIKALELEQSLVLEGDCGVEKAESFSIPSNLQRELCYNLEHSIHHQAIIKIGLKSILSEPQLIESFGVAPSTMRAQ
jgi:hypothetical protein